MVVSPQPAFFAHPVNVKCENKYLLRTLSQAKKVDLLLSTLYIYKHNRLMAIFPGLPGRAGSRRNIHPLTAMRRKKKDSHRQQGLLFEPARFVRPITYVYISTQILKQDQQNCNSRHTMCRYIPRLSSVWNIVVASSVKPIWCASSQKHLQQ